MCQPVKRVKSGKLTLLGGLVTLLFCWSVISPFSHRVETTGQQLSGIPFNPLPLSATAVQKLTKVNHAIPLKVIPNAVLKAF